MKGDAPKPTKIGRYEVVDQLGAGGMGIVYLATDPLLRRTVAIKALPGHDEELRERFAREGRSAASLRHNNIVTIYDVGEDNGNPFLAMEFIDGESMSELIRRRAALTLEQRLTMMIELCAGLGYAHRNGIVHRDIKPGNLMITAEGTLKVLDFGLARITTEGMSTGLTRAGSILGTPHYMSPEQIEGQPVDPRSDIFSVGLVFYELLSYQRAYSGDSAHVVLHNIIHTKPRPLQELVPEIDPNLLRIVEKSIEKQPENRYQDLRTLAAELERVRARVGNYSGTTRIERRPAGDTPSPKSGDATPARQGRARAQADLLAQRRITQVDSHVKAAGEHVAAGRYEDAVLECENAMLLNPQDQRALSLLAQAQAAIDDRLVRQHLSDARAHLAAGELSEAQALIEQTLALHADLEEAQQLRRAIREQRAELERKGERIRAARTALDRARRNLEEGAFEAASRSAAEVLAYDAGNEGALEVRRRAAEAIEARRLQQERDLRVAEVVEQARVRAAAGSPRSALSLLEAFAPPHPLVTGAIATMRAEVGALEQREREEAEQERQRVIEAEEQARHEAEEKARRQAEEKARREADEKARRDAEEKARHEAEEKARHEAEEKARHDAEEKARRDADEKARREADEKARREADEKARREADEKARREADEKARREADEKARRDAEEKARRDADEKARRDADEKARRDAEEKARRDAEEKARRDAEEKARRDADEKARRVAEEKARRDAEEKARREADEKARRKADEKARREADEKARREADEKARREADEKARREADEKARRKLEEKARRAAEKEAEKEATTPTVSALVDETAIVERSREADRETPAAIPPPAGTVTTPVTGASPSPLTLGGVAAALALLVGGGWYFTQDRTEPAPPTVESSAAAEAAPDSTAKPADSRTSASAPAAVPSTPAPAPSTPAATAPAVPDAEVGRIHTAFTTAMRRNDLDQAVRVILDAPAAARADETIAGDAGRILAATKQRASDALAQSQVNPAALASDDFRAAETRRLQALNFERRGQLPEAARGYLMAASGYARALTAKPAPVSQARETTNAPSPAAPTTATPVKPLPPVSNPTVTEPPSSPPEPSTTPPTARAPVDTTAVDTAAIKDTLAQFVTGYERLDVAAIRRVYPNAPATLTFDNVRSYSLTLEAPQISISGDRATVRTVRRLRVQMRAGSPQQQALPTEFSLRRAGSSWVVEAIK